MSANDLIEVATNLFACCSAAYLGGIPDATAAIVYAKHMNRTASPACALIIDDQPIFRTALERVVRKGIGNIDVLFAENVADALCHLEGREQTLVIACLSTVDISAGGALEAIIKGSANAPVVVLDRRHVRENLRRSKAGGAKAYIVKTSTAELIEAALGVVMAGGVYFPDIPGPAAGPVSALEDWVARLSPRQREVLRLLSRGRTNQEISQELGIAVATVKLHVQAVLRAAEVRNRTEAVLRSMAR